ncbi:putative uncharacterized protein [Collinsella sp. CAG:398]|nr:putative uncharacterized protein [Collinsella sp. CAG:398]
MLKKIGAFVLCVALGAVLVLGFQHFQNANVAHPEGRTDIDLTVLKESMEKNSELSTAKYLYTSSVSVTDQNTMEVFGVEVVLPFTDATYIFEFDGEIKAGYKLENVKPFIENGNTVVIELPPAEILSHETSDVTCMYEQQNIANPLKAGEESKWIEGQKTAMAERAESLGLYNEAQQNAKVVFESLFEEAIPEGATLEIRFQ